MFARQCISPRVKRRQFTFAGVPAGDEPLPKARVIKLFTGSASGALVTKVVDALAQVLRPRQLPFRIPPLGRRRQPVREMEVGTDVPIRQVGEGDKGLDLLRVGVDTLVLGLQFRGPHTQTDIPAAQPHIDPVDSVHLLWEFDLHAGRINQARRRKHCSPSMFPRDPGSFFQDREQLSVMVCVFQRSPRHVASYRVHGSRRGSTTATSLSTPAQLLPRLSFVE